MRRMERTIAFIFTFVVLVYLLCKSLPDSEPKKFAEMIRDPKKQVLIYAATKFFGMDITTERFLSVCKSTTSFCRITENPAEIDKADAILFHNADYRQESAPKPRKLSRPHVLWSLESPTNDRFRPAPHVINWTMTFRRDADIWYPYGHFRKLERNRSVDLDAIWNMKNQEKMATWLASNCKTSNSRSELVNAMLRIKAFPIDRYGSCGFPAPGCEGVNKQSDSCVTQLIRPYKFYISIENSNCADYVTEKFYEALITRMTVPIVLKRKTYIDVGAPPNSFVAIDDFASIADMVKFLNEAAADKNKYLQFHKWRTSYEALPEHHDDTGFCELCRRLQQNQFNSKSYADVQGWHEKDQCENNYGLKYLTT
ncbi:fucosyl transferase [Necator americanus]|uniref:Fucosyltransferase n=1 Tax=Necator americanus TaxID=51031 RepID=W2T5T5_NECAM|nr:fucosyl transferase [Necator americanus]ETN77248.1 fucosyl transferase [Necator americanus]